MLWFQKGVLGGFFGGSWGIFGEHNGTDGQTDRAIHICTSLAPIMEGGDVNLRLKRHHSVIKDLFFTGQLLGR